MAGLLAYYEEMQKRANAEPVEEQVKEAEAEVPEMTEEEAELVQARMEVFSKYASAADDLLAQQHGDDYTANDVEELATLMINHDLAVEAQEEEMQEKVAEAVETGQIIARAHFAELQRLISEDE